MLKLTLRPGEFIDIGEDVRVIFSGGSANNIHLLVDAPRELNIARSNAGSGKSPYYREKGISEEAKREITEILMREKHSGSAQSQTTQPQGARDKDKGTPPKKQRFYTNSR